MTSSLGRPNILLKWPVRQLITYRLVTEAVKGGRVTEVTEKTLQKKYKEKAFAAGCEGEKVVGITRFMALGEFFSLALGAMQEIRGDLRLE
ncbi:MAG: hypothetical protein A4E36_01928 [Methanoregulaceae archaeon PtaB.Bin009]|jgi:predicted hydrolase (HD superfamily)|nr:MAG: hypothetical protein A4E36_01928 [Methanoregulaceae archaeon PtaB.Bin009]OPY40842.1 MAG: hypothetical protein A4E41_01182 [Methanoregulaceae archaeon PtaU1.Bin066]HNQ30657.1 hypothetical protein [Methanolinea sp.]